MALEKNRGQYEKKYRSVKLTGGEAAEEQISEALSDEGQVTEIRIFGEEVMDFDLTTTETDTSTETGSITLAGNSEYHLGSFQDPVIDFGAGNTVALENLTSVSDSTVIGAQLLIHERTG